MHICYPVVYVAEETEQLRAARTALEPLTLP